MGLMKEVALVGLFGERDDRCALADGFIPNVKSGRTCDKSVEGLIFPLVVTVGGIVWREDVGRARLDGFIPNVKSGRTCDISLARYRHFCYPQTK